MLTRAALSKGRRLESNFLSISFWGFEGRIGGPLRRSKFEPTSHFGGACSIWRSRFVAVALMEALVDSVSF